MPSDVRTIETLSLGQPSSEKKNSYSYFLQFFDALRERAEYRRDLKRLLAVGPHMIEDLGLSLEEVRAEVLKSFWEERKPLFGPLLRPVPQMSAIG